MNILIYPSILVLMHCYVPENLTAGWNSITGTLPSELFELPNIRHIGLEYNYISGSIPENIGRAESLGESRIKI